MDQRISLVTLGVDDLTRALRFCEALGWEVAHNPGWTLDEHSAVHA